MDWTDYPRVALVLLLVVTNLGLVVAMSTSGVSYGPYNSDWNGGAELRSELRGSGATPTLARTTDAYIGTERRTVAVVLAPTSSYDSGDTARVRQFVSSGGTLVVASENTNTTNPLLADLGVQTRLNGTTVLDDQNNYRNASLPRVTNVSDHPLTDGVDQLTLNQGTVLDVPDQEFGTQREVTVLARTSAVAYLDRNGNFTLDEDEPFGAYPVAVAEPVGQGRVVVVSDASVFTNAMLEQEGNAAFARSLGQNATTALVDYSHRPPLPPLTYSLLLVRGTPVLQATLTLLVLAGIALLARRPSVRLPDRVRSLLGSTAPDAGVDISEADVVAFVRQRHPDWDADRVERVSQHIIRQRDED